MPRQTYTAGEAARRLGISIDTLRRWDRQGRIRTRRDHANRRVVSAREVERLRGESLHHDLSARNRLVGLVTSVVSDKVMSQVEMQCGPHRVVSLMSTEAVGDLGLEPGVLAVAVIKSTNVVVETPGGNS